MTSSFSFTNISDMASVKVTPVEIDPISTYAKSEDSATNCELKNKTCDLGQGEMLSFQCTGINNVSTKQPILNPAKVLSGVQYIVRLDEILRTKDIAGNVICDEPIVMYLTVRHPNSSNIEPTHVEEVFKRLVGACLRNDGSYRFDDLMLSALAPVAD